MSTFYGSNEIGPFSSTSLADDEERRLGTVGVVPGARYRLYDDAGRPSGYLLLPDLVTAGEAGYLRITGRKTDIIWAARTPAGPASRTRSGHPRT